MACESRQIITACTRLGKLFQASLCEQSVVECRTCLLKRRDVSTSVKLKACWNSKIYLLDELACVKSMPVHMAYDEYLGHLQPEFQPAYRDTFNGVHAFLDSLIKVDGGLPVLIINCPNGERYIMLYEYVGQCHTLDTLQAVDQIVSGNLGICSEYPAPDTLHQHFKSLMNLLISARERAVVICMLSLIYSSTSLHNNFEIHEDVSLKFKKSVIEYSEAAEQQNDVAQAEAETQLKTTLDAVVTNLASKVLSLERNSDKLTAHEYELRETDISHTTKRITKLQHSKNAYVRRVAAQSMKAWKQKLFSQRGKGA